VATAGAKTVGQRKKNGQKWINAGVAIAAILLGYIVTLLAEKTGQWFDLEAKISEYGVITQVLGGVVALITFLIITRNPKSSVFLEEVYAEMEKVVYPNRQETVRHSIVVIIGVTIAGFIFGVFDLVASKLLALLH